MADKTTKWILELVDQITAPLKGIEAEAKLVTDVGVDLGDSFDKAGKEAAQSGATYTKLGQQLHDQRLEAAKAAQDIDDLGKAADRSKTDMDGLGKEAVNTSTDVRELGDEVEVSEKAIKDFTASFKDLFEGFQTGNLAQISDGFKGVANNIGTMTRSALAFIATPLGATLAGLAIVGMIATDFVRYNEAARETNVIVAQMTQLEGDAVSQMRVRAQVMEEVFGQDLKDTLTIAKNNVQAFGITYEEAMDNIGDALVRGGAANDEYLDSMREYPRMFANAGFNMQEFQKIIDTGFDLGMYSDKLPDAIKELDISLKERTQSSQDALENAFGKKFTDELFQNITNGSITTKEALRQISEETERVGVNTQEAAALTADLFRGAGEDAGGYIEIINAVNIALDDEVTALTGVENQLNKVYEATEAFREAQQAALESDSYVAFAQEMELFWLDIKTGYYYGLVWAQEWFDGTTSFYTQLVAVAAVLPQTINESWVNILEDLGVLTKTFMSAGDIINDALHFRFDDAAARFRLFKMDLEEDLTNLGKDIVIDPYVKLGNAYVDQGKDVDAYRESLAYYAKQGDGKTARPKVDATGINDPTKDKKDDPKKERTGGGSGAGKSITMTLNIVQNFAVAKGQDIEEVARETVRLINDQLRDAVITLN